MAQEGNPLLLSHELLSLLDNSDTDQLLGGDMCVEPPTDSQSESTFNLNENSCVNASSKRPLEQSSSAHSHQKEPPKKPKRIRRQRQELLYLRDKAKELETQLNKLKSSHTNVRSSVQGDQQQEYYLRTEAERENKRLRAMLQEKLDTISSLANILSKSTGEKFKLSSFPSHGHSRENTKEDIIANELDTSKDSAVFESLLTLMDESYENIDSVIDRINASGVVASGPQKRVQVLPHPENSVYLLGNASHIVPFDLDVSCNAFWKLLMDIRQLKLDHWVELFDFHPPAPSFTKAGRCRKNHCQKFTIRGKEQTGSIHAVGRRATRCYVEKERIVLVFAAQVRPIELSGAPIDGLMMVNQGAVILEKEGDVESPFTRVKVEMTVHPRVDDAMRPNQETRVGEVTDFILDAQTRKGGSMVPLIEQFLVQEDLKKFMEQ